MEQRRRLLGANVRITHRLTRTLTNDCPHVRPWFRATDTAIFCDVLPQGPPLKAVQLARRAPLARCFRAPHVRDAEVSTQRRHAIKRATPLTTEEGLITPQALLVQALVAQRRVTFHASADCDKAIAHRAQRHPDCPFCDALPGAGAVFAPRLLVACGAPRARDASADERQQYAGIAPGTARRGNKSWGHWRLQCPKFLRPTCVAWAADSTRHSCWARADYQQQRDKGASPQAAVRALAFTWIRLLLRCWQHRTRDADAVFLHALQRRGAPLLHRLAHGS